MRTRAVPTEAEYTLLAEELRSASGMLDDLERDPELAQRPDLTRALATLRAALTLTSHAATLAPAGEVSYSKLERLASDQVLPVLLAEYRELAGERSQEAKAALLRDLTATIPDAVAPASLRQATREAAHRQRLLRTPTYSYDDLRALRGDPSIQATRTAVSRMMARGQLFTVPVANRRVVVPAFLVDDAGEPRPELTPLVRPLIEASVGPWQLWTWLTSPTGLLSGGVPVELASDPATAERAAHAARRFADQVKPADASA